MAAGVVAIVAREADSRQCQARSQNPAETGLVADSPVQEKPYAWAATSFGSSDKERMR